MRGAKKKCDSETGNANCVGIIGATVSQWTPNKLLPLSLKVSTLNRQNRLKLTQPKQIGAGIGILTSMYGPAVDALESVRIVTASGDLVTASATENVDLF